MAANPQHQAHITSHLYLLLLSGLFWGVSVMEDILGLIWLENPRAGKKKKKKKESASCINSVEQARRWKQVTNRTPQQMTLEAAQLQLVGHDHHLFLPTSNPHTFDFNRKPPPFLEGNHDVALKFPFPKEVHGPALVGISSVEPPFISQTQTTDVLAKGSRGQTPEIRNEAMLSQRPAQLTIFYGDGVYVYSDITPKKAELIMSMAKDQPTTSSVSRPRQHLEVANNMHCPRAMYPQGTVPQARRATLVRFLEKRKDRLSSDIYYLIKKSSESSVLPP